MNNNRQKRKHDASGSSTRKKQKATPALSADVQLLTRVITKTEQPLLMRTLLASIPKATQSDLNAIKRLFEPLVTSAQNPLHCVRCHKNYFENENNDRSCVIQHDEIEYASLLDPSSDEDEDESDSDEYDYWRPSLGEKMKFPCCGTRCMEKEVHRQGPCIQTKHTTDSKEVEYYDDPLDYSYDERSERSLGKYECANSNVVMCKKKGCLV